MLDEAVTSDHAAQSFASEHGLTFHGEGAPELPAPATLHGFADRFNTVSGSWRGHRIQRFVTRSYVVELMVLPAALPPLMAVPKSIAYGEELLAGTPILTADAVLDGKWRISTANPSFASAFLNREIRELLAHEAATGKAFAIDGSLLYLWTPIDFAVTAEARVRFELLSVIAGRISQTTWEKFGAQAVPAAASLPAPAPIAAVEPVPPVATPVVTPVMSSASADEISFEPELQAGPVDFIPALEPDMGAPELPAYLFAEPEPEPDLPVVPRTEPASLTNTGELDIALLEAKLGGAFLPEGDPIPEDNGWIGGDVDTTSLYFTGPRVKGQARPR